MGGGCPLQNNYRYLLKPNILLQPPQTMSTVRSYQAKITLLSKQKVRTQVSTLFHDDKRSVVGIRLTNTNAHDLILI